MFIEKHLHNGDGMKINIEHMLNPNLAMYTEHNAGRFEIIPNN